jgi:hypothetical protein
MARTPLESLHRGLLLSHPATVSLALADGADIHAPLRGKTALRALVQSFMNGGTIISGPAMELLQDLLDRGAFSGLSAKDQAAFLPAVSQCVIPRDSRLSMSRTALQILLKNGVPIDSVNAKGETALFASLAAHNVRWGRLLLEAGADPSIANKHGHYPHEAPTVSKLPKGISSPSAELLALCADVESRAQLLIQARTIRAQAPSRSTSRPGMRRG